MAEDVIEEGGGTPEGGEAAADAATAAPDAAAAAGSAPAKPERPDYVPEKFWDGDAGAARLEDFGKSYAELERERGERTKRVPEKYQVPASFKGFEIPANHLKAVEDLARAESYSQQGFEQLALIAFGDPGAARKELEAAFGDKTDETLEACRLFASTMGDHEEAVRQLVSTPAGVKLLDAWRLASVEKGLPGAGGEGGGRKTEADLKKLMADPSYWRDRDPKVIAEVTQGWAELYGGQVETAPLNPSHARAA